MSESQKNKLSSLIHKTECFLFKYPVDDIQTLGRDMNGSRSNLWSPEKTYLFIRDCDEIADNVFDFLKEFLKFTLLDHEIFFSEQAFNNSSIFLLMSTSRTMSSS